MGRVKQIWLLILIFSLGTLAVASAMQWTLYQEHFSSTREELIRLVGYQARLIEAVARFDVGQTSDFPGGSSAATISQVVESHNAVPGFGKTGEFAMARRSGDSIEFILSHHNHDHPVPTLVAWDAEQAEPMRRALAGESGWMVGMDYAGTSVLAAYEPVAVLNVGIVAKIDMSEVRAPFWRSIALTGGLTLLVVVTGSFLFVRVTAPFAENLASSEEALRETTERLSLATLAARIGIWDWNVNDNVLMWDECMHDLYGVRHGDFSGVYDAWKNALHPEDSERVERRIQMALHGEEEFNTEFRIRQPDGATTHIKAIAAVYRDESDLPVRMLGANWDVTELRREQQRVQTQYEATRVLADAESLVTASPRILQIVCGVMEWYFGEMWAYDDKTSTNFRQ